MSGEEEKRLWAVIYRADGRSKVRSRVAGMGLDGCRWLLLLWKGREVKDPNPKSQFPMVKEYYLPSSVSSKSNKKISITKSISKSSLYLILNLDF